MPNLRVDRQEALRALAAQVRKQSQEYEEEAAKHPARLDAGKAAIVKQLEKTIEAVKSARTSEAVSKALGDNAYHFRKEIPTTPKRGACRHSLMLKQLQMDTRKIIPVSEKDQLWSLLVDRCEN